MSGLDKPDINVNFADTLKPWLRGLQKYGQNSLSEPGMPMPLPWKVV